MAKDNLTAQVIKTLNPDARPELKGNPMNDKMDNEATLPEVEDTQDLPEFLRRPLTEEELKELGLAATEEEKKEDHTVM